MITEHHLTLGILDPEASIEEIRKSWILLCKTHHPDKGGDPEIFKKITHAYKMLTDPSYQHSLINVPQKRDLNMRLNVTVSFEEAFFGTNLILTYNRIEYDHKFTQIKNEELEILTHTIKVPSGSNNGWATELKGAGIKCSGRYGDAILTVNGQDHPKYSIKGKDVISDQEVKLDILLKGGRIRVPTLFGVKSVKIPPATTPGTKIPIRKCGVNKEGNHIIELTPIFPNQEELKSDKYSGLNIDWTINSLEEENENQESV